VLADLLVWAEEHEGTLRETLGFEPKSQSGEA
jgi:hypothetical protein